MQSSMLQTKGSSDDWLPQDDTPTDTKWLQKSRRLETHSDTTRIDRRWTQVGDNWLPQTRSLENKLDKVWMTDWLEQTNMGFVT